MKLSSKLKNLFSLKKILFLILCLLILIIGYRFIFLAVKETFTPNVIKGYYLMSWKNSTPPPGTWDFGVWFGGESPKTAILNNINSASKITVGKKILDLGGGTPTGIWTSTADLDYVSSRAADIKKAGWDGLCFDVEVCTPNIDFIDAFKKCFAACKAAGLMVIVTISHSLPWSCQTGQGQGSQLVSSWINDSNIDYISPQLYDADGTTLTASDLSMFKNIQAKILPSIPYDSDWANLNNGNTGITSGGYIIWNVAAANTPSANTNFCGADWGSASCSNPCPKGQDNECPAGQQCYGSVSKCSTDSQTRNYCGVDWNTANSKCSGSCPKGQDSECPTGQQCYANLSSCPVNV